MELFDTHCHLDVEAFDADRAQVLRRARELGVRNILVPGIEASRWDGLLELCESEPGLYPALGLHPVFLPRHRTEHLAQLKQAVEKHRPVAIGEIGLDFFERELDREAQHTLFEAQLSIAREAQLPVVLHVRKAHDEVLSCLGRIPVPGGTVHAFNGSEQQARHYIDIGFKLGFGGTLTWERSRKIRALAANLPLEAIVLETDAPDMVVAQHPGERNSPEYLVHCLQSLAEVRDTAPDVLAQQTTYNARKVFGLS
ncbi:TatD DNase family protein [Thiogranum longum]|uniref:TatD DNase family protein n=1 Tax=Thiogranum longum TaxID=1537524 RepID=A0A4R1HA12_9GAMM|nr:TatD family hydrolase [Thiogranum longum]TCK16960.1 TatD DNase family protein [Thiogranum longum]